MKKVRLNDRFGDTLQAPLVTPLKNLTIDCTLMLVFEALPAAELCSLVSPLTVIKQPFLVGTRFNLKCGAVDQSASGACLSRVTTSKCTTFSHTLSPLCHNIICPAVV